MKNIPLFSTQSGIASLTLDQISFNKTAYIRVQDASDAEALLMECVDFCRAIGAEKIYASGNAIPAKYNECASILRLSRLRAGIGDSCNRLVPVDTETLEEFRVIYNTAMHDIPNATSLSISRGLDILEEKSAYFIYDEAELIGIGIAKDEWVHAIVSLKRGMGTAILKTLNQALTGEFVRVEVIDSNTNAMRLYERMGFQPYEVVSKWHKIL